MARASGHDEPLTPSATPSAGNRPPLAFSLIRLARPTQWSKSAFVVVGPFYGLRELLNAGSTLWDVLWIAGVAAAAFALASSGCYVVNDIVDRVADRAHPRKRNRPMAAGHVSVPVARVYAGVLFVAAAALVLLLPPERMGWVGLTLGLYVLNVTLYSTLLKHVIIADVMSLSIGFVLRVMGGCAAAGLEPSVWLLNVVFFLSMFLAFGKRLGERRTLAESPSAPGRAIEHRRVQAAYTDSLLQMAVVVTAVTTLMTYAFYVREQGEHYTLGFNLLWLTILPATYGLLRSIVVLDQGRFDDPTELAVGDRPFQAAGLLFAVLTVGLMFWRLSHDASAARGLLP